MKFRNMNLLKMNEADDGQGAGGAGGEDGGGEAQPTVEELQAKLADYEKSNSGMQSKMDQLLTEKKEQQRKAQEAHEARTAAELEASKNAGNLEEFEKKLNETHASNMSKKDQELERLNGMILGGKKESIINDLAGSFVSPEAAKLMLNAMIKTEHGENNTISTSYHGLDGQLMTTDQSTFKEFLNSNPAFAGIIKGVQSSGGMMEGSSVKPAGGAGGQVKSDKQARIDRINKAFQ